MKAIENLGYLFIKQKRSLGEIFTGIEQRNRYFIYDESGNELFFAHEPNIKFLWRIFFKELRPFEIHVKDSTDITQMIIKRKFRWFFHECSILSPDGIELGNVKYEFSWLNRVYSVTDSDGQEIYKLFGPLFRPWTFKIQKYEQEVGVIMKRWSGVFKEMFTDGDHFGINFEPTMPLKHKMILFGSVFLIDFVHFERK